MANHLLQRTLLCPALDTLLKWAEMRNRNAPNVGG